MSAGPIPSSLGDVLDVRARRNIHGLLAPHALTTAYQPIVRMADGHVVGYEALARARDATVSGDPLLWLRAAEALGLRPELELAFMAAVAEAGRPPRDALLFVNAGADLLFDPRMDNVRSRLSERIVIELTEQDAVDDYEPLRARLQQLANEGVRLAIDDTGAGYSSLQRVLQLSPEFLKLDRTLVHGLAEDRKLQALVRSLVAFARETGATVIAEGVERADDLDELRAAGVPLAQGFLLSHPGPPWPVPSHDALAAVNHPTTRRPPGRRDLESRLAVATTTRVACEAVCEHLYRLGELLPSAFIERQGLLRCQAQRGYWQIMDGFPLDVGILGRVMTTGQQVVIGDVGEEPDFVAAVPGLAAEIAVPLEVDGKVIGVLNVESVLPIMAEAAAEVGRCGALLSERIASLDHDVDAPLARLARASMELSGVVEAGAVRVAILRATERLSGLSSFALIETDTESGSRATLVDGPLRAALCELSAVDLGRIAQAIEQVSSCYTAMDPTGRTPVGTDRLRAAGAQTIVVLPLGSPGRRTGAIILADTEQLQITTEDVEALELLAVEADRALELSRTVAELERRAVTDPLTGLGNHSAFYEALGVALSRPGSLPVGVVVADIDGFKPVNDNHGHVIGDQLLKALANQMASVMRPGDRLFRIGGDELAAILPDVTGLEAAENVAARLCAAADSVLAEYGAGLSFGVAVASAGALPVHVVDRADQALYQVKRSRAVEA